MIKERRKPTQLKQFESLIRRLPPNHPQLGKVKMEAAKLYQGYIGEKKVDQHLRQLPQTFNILHDLYLRPRDSPSFQIDSLLITDYALFIIETKNFQGKVTFNTIHNQFTRNNGRGEEGYRYPITQAETTKLKLSNWLHQQHIPTIPIYYFIAISDPSTIIHVIGDEEKIAEVVLHAEYIPLKIIRLYEEIKKKMSGEKLCDRRAIGKVITQANREYKMDISNRFGITKSELLTGVVCPNCDQLAMIRIYNNWYCNKCQTKSRYAHKTAIQDYFLLNNSSITNAECRRMLHLSSKNIATNLLKKEGLHNDKSRKCWIQKTKMEFTTKDKWHLGDN